ncbi:phage baseplate assembly protein V [Sphingomonas sp. Leaf242]|uniref:phage baseplate assembly protein V n=1 Tax=Sphingomonas sp. Leaf242 TaxID=1736304 RepID=UPI00071410EE|nr:phage baseplate assembly protein V [Sphingomonas sp. Leaf242]KQO07862.1 baseplate assembly protein [Sphingomonas sp. Leaf242]
MSDPADVQRLIGDLAREGTVVSVDLASATCRVEFANDLTTGDIPWLAARVGKTKIWSPPSVGEQVAVLCPEADTARGFVIGSLSSDANPHPANDGSTLIEFEDGARILYDPDGHYLIADLPAGSYVEVRADDIYLRGNLHVTGYVKADGDVIGAGKSLKDHTHTGVQAGAAFSGPPR